MTTAPPLSALARNARQLFCSQVGVLLPQVCQDVRDHLNKLLDNAMSARDFQAARDALGSFDNFSRTWTDGVRAALQQRLQHRANVQAKHTVPGRLELLPTEAVEDQLLASKLALSIHEAAGQTWTDLRQRLMYAEGYFELDERDVVRPEVLGSILFEEWAHAGLSRDTWKMLRSVLHRSLGENTHKAYQDGNQFLVASGVMPTIELKHSVRKSPAATCLVSSLPTTHRPIP